MLHKAKVGRVIWYSTRRRVRVALGLKPRVRAWPANGLEAVVAHHTDLVRRFLEAVPAAWNVAGKTVCEAGCSDCLAIASFLLGKGAAKVDLVEPSPPVLDPLQADVLKAVQQNGFALDTTILRDGKTLSLDSARVTYHNCFMEALGFENRYNYLFSLDVMEHVEDLDSFYTGCRKALKPGGQMFHSIDFSGHGEFEDPVPPLDFQTYPDWLHDLMYPRFSRVTRSFLSDHHQAMSRAGLVLDGTRVIRKADPDYVAAIWPHLRSKARSLPPRGGGCFASRGHLPQEIAAFGSRLQQPHAIHAGPRRRRGSNRADHGGTEAARRRGRTPAMVGCEPDGLGIAPLYQNTGSFDKPCAPERSASTRRSSALPGRSRRAVARSPRDENARARAPWLAGPHPRRTKD